MNTKKLLCTLLALGMLLSLLPVTVFAAGPTASGSHLGLNWNLTSDGTLTVSGSGDMPDFFADRNGTPWYSYNNDIKKIVVKSGLTSIGEAAFYDCNATTAVIADTVTEIDDNAFRRCMYLKTIELPSGLKELGDNAFYDCDALSTITLPAGITEISDGLFYDSGITAVTCKGTITEIGERAFYSCDSLVDLNKISFSAAKYCEIGNEAFAYCDNLETVYLPKNVETICEYAFAGAPKLSKVQLSDGLKYIEDSVFYNCDSLTSITLPSSVISLEYSPFVSCDGLESITLHTAALEGAEEALLRGVSNLAYIHVIGNAPKLDRDTVDEMFNRVSDDFVIYYNAGTTGWSEPTWKGVPCAQWNAMANAQIEVTASNVAKTGKVKLTWDAVDGAVGYQIYRATSKDGTYSLMYTAKTNSYTNTNAKAGKYYYYQVVAVAEDGTTSAPSNIVGRTCDLPRPVVTASNNAKTGKVTLTWEPVEGAVSYKVYRSTSKDGTYSLMKTLTNTTYTNTNAVAGTKYYYKVVAVAEKTAANSAGTQVSRTCDLPQVQPSVKLNAKGKPNVTWKAVDGAVSYKVYRATSKDGTYSLMKTLTSTNYVNTNCTSGKTYFYKVVAVCSNTDGNSAASNIVSITAK